MTPEQQQQLKELYDFMQALKAQTTIPFDVDRALRQRLLEKLNNRPQTAIDSPSGGGTIDTEARAAIDSLITTLETLGLLLEN